jgi:hypothetical protein
MLLTGYRLLREAERYYHSERLMGNIYRKVWRTDHHEERDEEGGTLIFGKRFFIPSSPRSLQTLTTIKGRHQAPPKSQNGISLSARCHITEYPNLHPTRIIYYVLCGKSRLLDKTHTLQWGNWRRSRWRKIMSSHSRLNPCVSLSTSSVHKMIDLNSPEKGLWIHSLEEHINTYSYIISDPFLNSFSVANLHV